MWIDAAEVSFRGHIFEYAIPEIVIEDVSIESCYKDVRIAIVVVISDCHSHGIAVSGYTSFFGDVGKRAVAIVAKQPIGISRIGLLKRGHGSTVREEDVHTPIIVVIENRNAPQHQLWLVEFALSPVAKLKFQTCLCRDILKTNLGRQSGACREQQDQCDPVRR